MCNGEKSLKLIQSSWNFENLYLRAWCPGDIDTSSWYKIWNIWYEQSLRSWLGWTHGPTHGTDSMISLCDEVFSHNLSAGEPVGFRGVSYFYFQFYWGDILLFSISVGGSYIKKSQFLASSYVSKLYIIFYSFYKQKINNKKENLHFCKGASHSPNMKWWGVVLQFSNMVLLLLLISQPSTLKS